MTSAPKHVTNNYYRLVVLVFLSIIQSHLRAQVVSPTVLNTNGFYKGVNEGFITISIGEAAVTTLEGSGGIITQGFLQPELNPPCSDFELDYFPNPVIDRITIRDTACGKIINEIEVFDLLGNKVLQSHLVNREADVKLLGTGIFIVRAYSLDRNVLGTFKIVKIADQ